MRHTFFSLTTTGPPWAEAVSQPPSRRSEVLFALYALVFAVALFAGMLAFLEIGRRHGVRHRGQVDERASVGIGVVEGAVFGLLGLLLAFTFSGAAERFNTRRYLIVDEVNRIGTAWLRIDLLPRDAQPAARNLFRQYLDSRLESYRKLPDIAAAAKEQEKTQQVAANIWAHAVSSSWEQDAQGAQRLLLPALNEMFDIAGARTLATRIHPPKIIFGMLAFFALAGALLAGYGMAPARNWLHMVAFAATVALAAYVIVDLEYPRFGLIRVDSFDQALVELRAKMQ